MKTVLMGMIGSLFGLFFLMNLYFGSQVRNFVAHKRRISSRADLDEYKRMVKGQMWAAAFAYPLMFAPYFILFTGFKMNVFSGGNLMAIIGMGVGLLVVAQAMRKHEKRARSLPVEQDFSLEYQRVNHAWLHKLLPDW